MSHDFLSKNFEMSYDVVQQLDQRNISQLTKKVPFLARTIWAQRWPNLCILMSHDSLSEELFEVLWLDEQQ